MADKPENRENANRSRATFVGVEDTVVAEVARHTGRQLEVAVMNNVEELLTASGLGTLDCEVVVLGQALTEPVRLAQRIHTLDKNTQIIILASADLTEEYKRVIAFSPFLGDAVNLMTAGDIDALLEDIRRAVKRARRRCSYRRSIAQARALTGTAAPQAQEVSQYLGSLLEHAPIGMLTLDANGRIQTLNRRGREILDVSDRDVLDTPFVGFFMPVDQIRLGRILAGDKNFGGHFRISGESDEIHFVEVTASEFLSRTGQAGSMIILHDVSDRVNAENARRRAAAALQSSEDRFLEFAEVLRMIPWEADIKQQFSYVGEQAEEILGYPREQWYADNFWEHLLHPEDRESALKTRMENSRRLQNFNHQYRLINADGKVVWIHDIVNVVRDEYSSPVKLRGFMVDVSEKNQYAPVKSQRG